MSTASLGIRTSARTVRDATLTSGAFALSAAATLLLVHASASKGVVFAIGAVLAVGIASWMFATARTGVALVVLFIFLGTLDGFLKLKIGRGPITLGRDVLIVALGLGLLARRFKDTAPISLPPMSGLVLLFVAFVLAEVANPLNGSAYHSFASLRQHIEFVPLFFIGYATLRTKQKLRTFLLLLLVITGANALVAVVQFRMTPSALASWGPGYAQLIAGHGDFGARVFTDAHGQLRLRPPALGSDMGFGGILGLLAAPAALAFLGAARVGAFRLLAAIPLAAGVLVAIATSEARVAVVGGAIAVAVFVAFTTVGRRGVQSLLAVVLGTALVLVLLSAISGSSKQGVFDRYKSISPSAAASTTYQYRKSTFSLIPTYAREFPLGAGLGTVGPALSVSGPPAAATRALNAESEPTFLIIELGLPGLFLLTTLMLRVLGTAGRRIHRIADSELRVLLAAIAAPLFGILATWVVGVASASSPSSPYFWFASGVLSYWLHERRPDQPRVPVRRAHSGR